MIIRLQPIILAFIFIFLCSFAMAAESERATKSDSDNLMKTMVITPIDELGNEVEAETVSPESEKDTQKPCTQKPGSGYSCVTVQPDKVTKDTSPAETLFVPFADLTVWPYIEGLNMPYDNPKHQQALDELQKSAAQVSPYNLLLASSSLLDRNVMRQGLIYYQLAFLRNSFDKKRWPDNNAAQNRYLGNGAMIARQNMYTYGYMMHEPERVIEVTKIVLDLDARTAYAYVPDFKLTDKEIAALQPEKWPELHKQARQEYIDYWQMVVSKLWPKQKIIIGENN